MSAQMYPDCDTSTNLTACAYRWNPHDEAVRVPPYTWWESTLRGFLAALCVGAIHAQAQNHDPDKFAAKSAMTHTTSQFQLRMAPLAPHITKPDRRYTLQSGLDPEAGPSPANCRFSLHSELRDPSNLLACGGGDAIFADGFQ